MPPSRLVSFNSYLVLQREGIVHFTTTHNKIHFRYLWTPSTVPIRTRVQRLHPGNMVTISRNLLHHNADCSIHSGLLNLQPLVLVSTLILTLRSTVRVFKIFRPTKHRRSTSLCSR